MITLIFWGTGGTGDWQKTLDMDIMGAVLAVEELTPKLAASGSGSIVFMSSTAALETFIARELYDLSLADWQHLTASFTFGGGDSKAELDDIIRQSLALW